MMNFQVGEWWHEAPDKEADATGKRAIVRHLCFGPLETRIWYESEDGEYSHEVHFIEGIQEGDRLVDSISRKEMLEVIRTELALCEKYKKPELAALFQGEIESIEKKIYKGKEYKKYPENKEAGDPECLE